jgi:uncharacterized protein (DUF1501 family)
MVGCSAAIAGWTGGLRFTAFGSPEAEPNQEILIVVFLRGGMDGLNVVAPIAGPDRAIYESRRPNLAIPTSGTGAALPLDARFGLHAGAGALHGLYQSGKLAIVHAAGLTSDTRSHFDAMQFMELGTPDSKSLTSGWLTRHLESATNLPAQVILPAVSVGNQAPTSLLASRESIGMNSPDDFSLGTHWRYGDGQRRALRDMHNGLTWLHQAGRQTLDAVDTIELANPGSYTPGNGATYPGGGFGNSLRTIAQVIRMQLGLRVATADSGGWDTHEGQGDDGGGYFSGRLDELARGLEAFFVDMSNVNGRDETQRITVVVMSEFGRSFQENASHGTDHGHGNVMLLLGGKVNGGRVHGEWPGLGVDQLYDRRDLAITTDYRRVLSEILIRRMGNPHLGQVFPGYTGYAPLGVVQGTDSAPIYAPAPPPTGGGKVYIPTVRR